MKTKSSSKMLLLVILFSIFIFSAIQFGMHLDEKSETVLLAPKDSSILTDRTPLFSWSGPGNIILIDDNADFSSPMSHTTLQNMFQPEKELDFGVHYWKITGEGHSPVQSFTIDSFVALSAQQSNNSTTLENKGNNQILITQYSNAAFETITGFFVLDKKKSIEGNEAKYLLAEQHE